MLQILWTTFLSNPEYYIGGAYVIVESVRRAMKTKNPDNLIQMIGKGVAAIFDAARVPNGAKGKKLDV